MRRNPQLARLADDWGIVMDDALDFLPPEFRTGNGYDRYLAMDAQPTPITTSNSGIPAFLTTFVDPDLIRILIAPNRAAEIFGEARRGTWLDETAMFTVIEHTGEVSSYGDVNNNGRAGANTQFPQRQSYLYQTITEYGEREMERMGQARINWAAEIRESAVERLNAFQNLTYFYGVAGLQNYGLLNDPSLPAALTPSTKGAGGTKWVTNGVVTATANEVFGDIQSLVYDLVNRNIGWVKEEDEMTLCMSPGVSIGLTATNSFGVNVYDLLKKNFPKMRVETAVQYGVLSTSNPQGIAGGNLVQLIAKRVGGRDVGFCAFNEKLRTHPIKRELSSFQQKLTQGSWGAIIRQPSGISQMLGV